MPRKNFRFALAASTLLLASCGGGSGGGGGGGLTGGGGGGGTTITFSGPADITLDELPLTSDAQEITTVSASSNASGTISFRLLSGKDSAFVSLNQGSFTLRFDRRPSFETPRDANGDNVYEFDVEASLGTVTVVRTYRVTIRDTVEGFSVASIASGLGSNGSLSFLPQANELLIVSEGGQVSILNTQTSALSTGANVPLAAGESISATLVAPFLDNTQNFYALFRRGAEVSLEFVSTATGQRRALWSAQIGADNEATLGEINGNLVIGVGDGRQADTAQDSNDIRGSLLFFSFGQFNNTFSNPMPADISVQIGAIGLRSPLVGRGLTGLPAVLDVGETFNEATEFFANTAQPNLEWPFLDGTTNGPSNGTPAGERLTPYATLAIDGISAGRWQSFMYLAGEIVVHDDLGNVFFVRDQFEEEVYRVENYTTDLRNAGLGNDPVVAVDNDIGYPAYLLDADGDLFQVDRSF